MESSFVSNNDKKILCDKILDYKKSYSLIENEERGLLAEHEAIARQERIKLKSIMMAMSLSLSWMGLVLLFDTLKIESFKEYRMFFLWMGALFSILGASLIKIMKTRDNKTIKK